MVRIKKYFGLDANMCLIEPICVSGIGNDNAESSLPGILSGNDILARYCLTIHICSHCLVQPETSK